MSQAFEELKASLREIGDVEQAEAVLGWDQRTYMPLMGAEARSRQLATLAKIVHEKLVAAETQEQLAKAEAEAEGEQDPVRRAYLRVARRNMDKATKVPLALVVEMAQTFARAESVWEEAKNHDDWGSFAPWLEKIVHLKQQYARAIGFKKRIYDALLDDYEEGMTADDLDGMFEALKGVTVPLVRAIAGRAGRVDERLLQKPGDEGVQERFARKVLGDCGYDWKRGRLDRAAHTFCTNLGRDDVRITTRMEPENAAGALFSCLHEMGHAFYEMNSAAELEGTPLAGGVSLGVHESQSRLWENLVGRSRVFWRHYFPQWQQEFAGAFGAVAGEDFYRAINRVRPSLIRTESDEVTYNLHIILRYEMEQELLEGRLQVSDAPGAWNAKMRQYLGMEPKTHREGILQDVHWSGGGMGYFPTYTLGNILSVQFFEAATKAHPEIAGEIEVGRFGTLLGWLGENIHRHGKIYPPRELVRRATGREMTIEPYAGYLKRKYGEIYGL